MATSSNLYRLPLRPEQARRHGTPGARVVALLSSKRGTGKTTLATHLAGEFAMQGRRVVLLDADPQGSALNWAQRRAQRALPRLYGVYGLGRELLRHEAESMACEADLVVIDGPPGTAALMHSAMLAADLVLIPVQLSSYDVWAARHMARLVAKVRVFRPAMRAAFVTNRRVVGTLIGDTMRAALTDPPLPTLRAQVCQRFVFADSAVDGQLACEAAPLGAAAREIAALAQAVREALP
jgi:chromosome partitioning protein